jgi:hypothetical protein
MRNLVQSLVLVGCLLASGGRCPASILGMHQLKIDFAKPDDAKANATWSEPDKIDVGAGGLGWDGPGDTSRDGWIKTRPVATGTSWRPARGANVRVTMRPVPGVVTLANGQTFQPSPGSLYVRYSADATHWSDWQALRCENPNPAGDAKGYQFSGVASVPHEQSADYDALVQEYTKLDVPWKSDEEAACRWIAGQRDPNFFREHKPFVGYVQFLYETSFRGGQRISSFDADIAFGVGGIHMPAKDPEASKDRDGPWRFKAP